jgi:hypothetical protein
VKIGSIVLLVFGFFFLSCDKNEVAEPISEEDYRNEYTGMFKFHFQHWAREICYDPGVPPCEEDYWAYYIQDYHVISPIRKVNDDSLFIIFGPDTTWETTSWHSHRIGVVIDSTGVCERPRNLNGMLYTIGRFHGSDSLHLYFSPTNGGSGVQQSYQVWASRLD